MAAKAGQPSPEERAILAYVGGLLAESRRRFRTNGLPWPIQLEAAWLLATGRQEPPELDRPAHVPDVVVVTCAEAARRLSVGERTVERLVRSGALPTVKIAESPRIRVSDLLSYVDGRPLRSAVGGVDSSTKPGSSGRTAHP